MPFAVQEVASRCFQRLHVAQRTQFVHVATENLTHAHFRCELQLVDAADFRCPRAQLIREANIIQLQDILHPRDLANLGHAHATFDFNVDNQGFDGGWCGRGHAFLLGEE